MLQVRATPWSPEGSVNTFDIQVGMERPAEVVPQDPGEVLMENNVARTSFRRADFEQWGLSEGCPGCRYLRTGQGRQQAHSEACQKKGDSMGAARLAAADERINRASADAVERHATKDPGVRGMLKRAMPPVIPSRNPKRRLHWTQSRNRHHAPRSRMEDHPYQARDPAPPPGPRRTPTRVT